jgi:AcrR family transcriptional regulator
MEIDGRKRLLEAMLLELAEHGHKEASMSRACQAAGVALSEFETEFADADQCLFAAYEQWSEDLLSRARAGCEPETEWPERIRSGLTALLGELAARPQLARVLTRSFPAIGPRAYDRYNALLTRFAGFVAEGRHYSGLGDELPDEVELLAVGAAESLIIAEIDAGRAEQLPAMMPEILFSLLVPFIGPEQASEQMRDALGVRP